MKSHDTTQKIAQIYMDVDCSGVDVNNGPAAVAVSDVPEMSGSRGANQ